MKNKSNDRSFKQKGFIVVIVASLTYLFQVDIDKVINLIKELL